MNFFELFPFVSFLVLSVIIAGRTIYLRKQGISVSSKSENTKKSKYILYLVFLIIMHLWIFEISNPVLHISILPEIISEPLFELFYLKLTGIFLTIISLLLLTVTLINFRNSLRFGMETNNLGRLITSGIFSISRNPFFVSIELYFIGTALIMPSLFIILFAFTALISIHFFILKEEKFMRQNYGEEYKNYSKKVRRYF